MPDQITYSDLHKDIPAKTPDLNKVIEAVPTTNYQIPKTVDLKNYQQFLASDAYKELGINPNLTQEEMTKQYDAAQSYGEAVSNSFGKFWNKTSNSFKDFFKADLDTITNIPANFKDTINLFSGDKLTNSSLMDHMYQELKDEEQYDIFHPNFDSRDESTRNSFLQWIPGFRGSADNYEQFLPSLGYTVGMVGAAVVQEGIVTLATGGLGDAVEAEYAAYKGKKIYDLLTGFKLTNAKNAWEALKTFNEGDRAIKGLKIGLEGLNMYTAFKSEAAMEAASTGTATFDAINKEYIDTYGYALSGKEREDAQQEALRAANTTYLLNAPILLTSNLLQFSKLFMPVGARVLEDLTEQSLKDYKLVGKLGKAVFEKEASIGTKLASATSLPAKLKVGLDAGFSLIKRNKGTLTEGLEESLQRFASDYSQDYFTKQFKDKKDWNWDSMGNSIGYSLADITSKKGLQEFIGGAVIGSLTHLVGFTADKTGATDKWAKFTGGETSLDKEKRNEKFRANILDLVNNSSIDFALKDEGFANLVKESLNSKELIHYNNDQDLFNAANAKYLGLYNMVWNAVKSGKTDFIISQLKAVANSSDKTELANKLGINPEDINHENLHSLVNSITDKITETEKNFKSVQKQFTKTGTEKKLIDEHNNSIKILINRTKDLAQKYGFELNNNLDIEEHWDKLTGYDANTFNYLASNVEKAKMALYAYNEAVKVAAINYQSLEDSSKRSNDLLNQLNNNKAGLNYSESLQLLEKKNLRELRKKAKVSLELATEPSDKKIYQKQLDAIEKADKTNNHEERADAMHEYAKSFADLLANNIEVAKHEYKSGYKQKLVDISKLQKQQRGNLDIYTFLTSAHNFNEYREHTFKLFQDFFNNVYNWKEQIEKKELTSQENITVTSDTIQPVTPTPKSNVVLTSTQQEQYNKLAEKHPNFNIVITRDENGKHSVYVEYKSSLFGKLPEEKTEEINQEFKPLLSILDENYEKELKIEKDTADLKVIIDKYNNALDNLDLSKITLDKADEFLNGFLKDAGGKTAPSLKEEINKINKRLLDLFETAATKPDPYNVEGEEFIPEQQLLNEIPAEEKETVLGITSGKVAFMSMLKTSSRDSENISKQEEVLTTNPYYNFLRQFKDYLPNIKDSFLSIDIPEEHAEFRLVIRKDSKELQEKYQTSNSPILGEVIVVQTKDNGIWKDAYFDDNFNHSIVKTDNNKLVIFSFTNPINNSFNINEAIKARELKNISTPEQSEIHFALEREKLGELRKLAQIEDQPILFTDLSNGVLINDFKKTTASFVITKELNPVITIASQKNSTYTLLGNQYVLNGSAHVKVGDNYLELHPHLLSEEMIDEMDKLMLHTYNPEAEEDINNVIKYLSTFVYTKPGLRQFVFDSTDNHIKLKKWSSQEIDNETIDLSVKLNTISDFIIEEPLILNISKNRLSNNYKYLINNKGELQKQSGLPIEDYVQFVLNNSDIKGEIEVKNGIPSQVRVNKYITFAQAIESTPNNVVTNTSVSPEIITPTTDNDLSSGGFDAFGELLSSKQDEETLMDYTYERIDPIELEWVKSLAGKAGQKVLFKAANSEKWGQFTVAAITLFDAKSGTGYHEGWHTFSQMFLTKEQKLKLYSEVRNKVKSLKNATPLEIEEYLAEDFKKYVLSNGTLILNKTPERQNIFQKIWNFIKGLFTSSIDLEKLYRDLRHGDLYEYTPSVSNAFWGHLNSAKGFEELPIDKLITYSKHADCVIGQILTTPLTDVSGKYKGTVITNLRSATEALKEPTIKNLVKNELLAKFKELNGTKKFNEDISYIINNFENFIKFNSEYTKSGFDLTDEEEPKVDEENLTKDTVYDRMANEVSTFEIGKEATKELLSLVPRCKWNGSGYEIVYDRNGLMTSTDLKVLWTLLASELENSLLQTDTIAKINDVKLQKKIPELGYIVDYLIPRGDNLNQQQKNVISQFHQSFSKVYVPIVTTVFKTNEKGQTEVFERYETKNNIQAIQQSARVNFFSLSNKTNFVKNGIVAQINGRNTLTEKYLSERFDFSKNTEKIRFLNLLGFDVTLPLLNKDLTFQEIGKTLELIDVSLKNRIERKQTITNPISDVSVKVGDDIPSEKGNVNKVLEMISNVTLKNPSMSHRGANGQMKYGLQQYNKITQTNYWLSTSPSYEQMISINNNGYNLDYLNGDKYHLTRGSLFIELSFGKNVLSTNKEHKRLKDYNNNPITIQIESYDGMEEQDKDSKPSNQKSTSDLNYRQKLKMDFNSLLINGRISMIQPASKRTYYSMKLSSYNRFSSLSEPNYISLDSVIDSNNPYTISKFVNVYKNYLEAELFKVANKDYAKLNQDNFTLFDIVLSEKLQATLKKEAKASKEDNYFDIIEKHSSDIITEMTSYFQKVEDELHDEFALYDISKNDLATSLQGKTDNFNKFIQAYVMNTYILGMEELKLFHADPSFYNKVKGTDIKSSFFKRAGQNISTGAIPNVSDDFLNYQFNTQQFSFASVFGKTKAKEDFAKTTFQTISDQIVTNHPMLQPSVIPGTKITTPKLIVDVANSYKILQEGITGKPIEITQELINQLSNSFLKGNYNKINVTDGGGLSTLDFYRQIRDAVGNWEVEDEYLYRALAIEFKLAKNNLTEDQKNSLTKQMNNYFDLAGNTVFNILKLQANLITVINGVPTPILHKFSIAPIFFSSVKGKQLEDIHDSMLKNGIDYLPFDSASKAYTPNLHEIITNGNLSLDNTNPTSIPLGGLKEQIVTANKEKKGKTRGVQITQLTLSNLMHQGKPIDFAGTKEEFQKLPYDKLTPLGKIYRDNLNNLRELKNINRQELYKELGLEVLSDGKITITNSEKLVKKLHQLAEQRQANSNIKTYVSFDKDTKDFSNPLEFALNRDEIKKLINGLLDRKLRVMKANGSQAIQMSDFGQQEKNHSFTNPTEEDLLKYGVNGLPFTHVDKEGKLVKMGCKITMTDNYKALLHIPKVIELATQNNISELQALNSLLKTKEFRKEYKESLSVVGYRIPTDGPSSMMLLDIYEFLPTYEGNKIILPAGVTTQSGTDYDIDKLSLFFKYLNHEGKTVSSNFNKKNVFKTLNSLKEKSDELLSNIDQIQKSKEFNETQIEISKNALEENTKVWNNLIEQYEVDEEMISKLENFIEHHQSVLDRYTKEVLGNSELAREYIKEFKTINQNIIGLKNQLNRKKQIENQIVKNYEDTLSHPAMLYSMLKPNTVASLESLAKKIGKKTGVEMTNFKNSELTKTLSSQKTHDELQEAKQALGIWAVGNTFFQNIAQTGLSLSGKLRIFLKDGSIRLFNTPNLLLTEEEESKYLDKEGNFNISHITDASGKLTKEILSEAMNMTVDVEGNPFVKQLGHNLKNAPIALYMTIKKIPIDRQWNFLNQPVLQHYYSELNKRGKIENKAIIAEIFNKYFYEILKNYLKENKNEEREVSVEGSIAFAQKWNSGNKVKFDLFELEDDIVKNATALLEANKNTKNNIMKRQLNIFTHYIALKEEADQLNLLRKNTNFPSRKIQGVLQANKYILDKKALLEEDVFKGADRNPFFELSSLKNYYDNSIANTYNELAIFKAVSEKMFPINSDALISNVFSLSYFKPNKQKDDLFEAKAEKILTNDIISTLYQNFGLEPKELQLEDVVLVINHPNTFFVTGVNQNTVEVTEINPLDKTIPKVLTLPKTDVVNLSRKTLHEKVIPFIDYSKIENYDDLIINRLKALKEDKPELVEDYPIINRFLPDMSKKQSLWNIELFRADANETSDKDSYIQQLKALCNHEDPKVSDLFRDIMLTGLYQSGYNLSPLFFTDIMNYDVILPIIHNANTVFTLMKKNDPKLYKAFVLQTAELLRLNNPSLYSKNSEFANPESFRGKNLTIDFSSLATSLLTQSELLEGEKFAAENDEEADFDEAMFNRDEDNTYEYEDNYAPEENIKSLSSIGFSLEEQELIIKGIMNNTIPGEKLTKEQAIKQVDEVFAFYNNDEQKIKTFIEDILQECKLKSI